MHRKVVFVFAFLLLAVSPALADRKCQDQPAPVRRYLEEHPGWSITTYDDLFEGDRDNWKDPDGCPGMAMVDLQANHHSYYGLSLIRRQGTDRFAKLVLLSPTGEEHVLAKERKIPAQPMAGGGPPSVEAGKPGIYSNYGGWQNGGPETVRMRRPVLYVYNLNTVAWLYYMQAGRLKKIQSMG
jgi:hypothetical protein